jgi:hypothetical protein
MDKIGNKNICLAMMKLGKIKFKIIRMKKISN